MKLLCDGKPILLFCENETNVRRLFGFNATAYFKDGISNFIVDGNLTAVNPGKFCTKAAAHYRLQVPAQASAAVRVRLLCGDEDYSLENFDVVMKTRRAEADEYYEAIGQDVAAGDSRLVQRRALAGMLWTKQFYHIDMPV
jgi:hypothetical protein